MRISIESEHRSRDHVNGNGIELQATVPGDPLDPFSHDRQGVLGQIDQHRSWFGNFITIEASRARGDAERHIERQPGFGTFWRAANDAHGGCAPKLIDQPPRRVVFGHDLGNADDRE